MARRFPLESPSWGLVTIGTTSLHTPAWQCVNSYLLTDPAPREYANRPRAGIAGEYGAPGFDSTFSVELEVQVIGDWDHLGLVNEDPVLGEEVNWRYLVDNVYNATQDAQGRVGVGVTSADPTKVYLGYVQMTSFRREATKGTSCCFLEVTLPSSGLVLVEV